MKTKLIISTLSALALASTFALAESQPGRGGKHGHPQPGEIFKKLDKDNSGGVTAEELKAARPHGGPGKGRGDCKKRGGGTAPAAA